MSIAENFEPEWWTPPRYRNDEKDIADGSPEFPPGVPEYEIRPLDGMEALDVTGQVTVDGDRLLFTGAALRSAVKYGLSGWRNLNVCGEELEFSSQAKRLVPALDLAACAKEIIGRTEFAGEDLKN